MKKTTQTAELEFTIGKVRTLAINSLKEVEDHLPNQPAIYPHLLPNLLHDGVIETLEKILNINVATPGTFRAKIKSWIVTDHDKNIYDCEFEVIELNKIMQ